MGALESPRCFVANGTCITKPCFVCGGVPGHSMLCQEGPHLTLFDNYFAILFFVRRQFGRNRKLEGEFLFCGCLSIELDDL